MVSTGGQSEKQGCWRRFKDAVREQYWVFTPLPASWTFYSFTPPQVLDSLTRELLHLITRSYGVTGV